MLISYCKFFILQKSVKLAVEEGFFVKHEKLTDVFKVLTYQTLMCYLLFLLRKDFLLCTFFIFPRTPIIFPPTVSMESANDL